MRREEEKNYYREKIGKNVKIGIPHYTQPRLFYYNGKLIDIEYDLLIITNNQGIRRIHISDVIEFTVLGE